jgi:hypothetical protein
MAVPPLHCGWAGGIDNVGILIDSPTGDMAPYILEKAGSKRVWKYEGSTWNLKPYKHPFPTSSAGPDTSWIVASAYPLGVFWSIRNRLPGGDSPEPTSLLWRPND